MNPRLLALLAVALVAAASTASPVVPAFERFHAKAPGARGGRLLLTELACVRCHKAEDKTLLDRTGPILSEAGSRLRVGHLRKFLSDPHKAKAGTVMPDLLAGDPKKEEKVEALVHLLASTGKPKHERTKSVASGRDLYSRVGCVACHGSRDALGKPAKTLPSSVPLGDLAEKWTLAGLSRFLQDPAHARPSGRMPKLLDAKEAENVASYLLQGQRIGVQGGSGTVAYRYYEGNWDRLPDFAKLAPAAQGIAGGFDLGVSARESNYGVVFEGWFRVAKAGRHDFALHSDDGSRLLIDGKKVVDNDGTHAPQTRTGSAVLEAGLRKLRVEFFQGGGEAELHVRMNGKPLAPLVSADEAGVGKPLSVKGAEEDAIKVDPALADKGAAVFASTGCANCHQLTYQGKAVESVLNVPGLAKLDAAKDCRIAAYGLAAPQRKALAAAVKELPGVKTPAEAVANTMSAFNCYACHVRDKVGGPPEELDKLFLTRQPEMGDEGRLPPPLDGAGAKLRHDYVKDILANGATHRQAYMMTRMPGFGGVHKGGFMDALEALDRLPPVPEPKFEPGPSKVKSQARHLVGANAMGCIKCHTFNGQKAEGVQGIDMVVMPKRLKRDWFHAYINDPQKIRPGTRMPQAFLKGKSVLPDILDGTALQQIEAMWLYLGDGTKAGLPVGVGGGKFIPLVPDKTAIIYRNFIAGAGPRAIAVGYPEKLHLAFDANDLRIALLWQGDFMNAGRHWNGRGEGNEPPLGDNVLRLHAGAPFAVLAKPDSPWPAGSARDNGFKFGGYKLDKQDRPTFRYAMGEVGISDRPNPQERGKDTVLVRTFTLGAKAGPAGLHFRAAVGDRIDPLADGWFKVDGTWQVKAPGGRVRKARGKEELVVPIDMIGNRPGTASLGSLTVEYKW
ncbi:MAG: c-type cytochrome [Gemmataceae bacterium]|nr:c-type cytochrome [Gemmataceae bacterium]